jgi:hypothetical protein
MLLPELFYSLQRIVNFLCGFVHINPEFI